MRFYKDQFLPGADIRRKYHSATESRHTRGGWPTPTAQGAILAPGGDF